MVVAMCYEDLLRNGFGERTVFSTFHIEALDLCGSACPVFHFDGGILLLLQKEQALENTIQVNFEEFVAIVHGFLELS